MYCIIPYLDPPKVPKSESTVPRWGDSVRPYRGGQIGPPAYNGGLVSEGIATISPLDAGNQDGRETENGFLQKRNPIYSE